jgi:Glycosyltransferase family 87
VSDRLRHLAQDLEKPLSRRLILGLFIALAITFTLVPFVRFLRSGTAMDYRTWFDAGQAVLRNGEIYPHSGAFPFMYPPTCALLLAGAAAAGKPAMIFVLTLLNTVAWIFCIKFSVSLATGESGRFGTAVVLVSNAVVLVFIWSSYHLGQPSLILLALMLGAFSCLRRDREILAGALIAVAAAIKAFPFLAIIYLVYRRYWVAAASLILCLMFVLFLLPIPVRGLQQTVADFREWQRGMLHYDQAGIAQRPARGYSWKNQSIWGLSNRLLRHVSAEDEGKSVIYANFADLNFGQVNTVIVTIALLFGVSFVAVMPRVRHPQVEPLEFGALLILILIFTPLAFGYLFSWLMLPLALLLHILLCGEAARITAPLVLTATILLVATAAAPRVMQIYGSVLFAALALYIAVAAELWRAKRAHNSVVR